MNRDIFGFAQAINTKPVTRYRIHAQLPNGDIGITPWYTEQSLDSLKHEIESVGHKIIKIERNNKEG